MPDETDFEADNLMGTPDAEKMNLETEKGDFVITVQPQTKVEDLKNVPEKTEKKSGDVSDCATCVTLCCDALTQCWVGFAACLIGCFDEQCCLECINGTCDGFVECLQGCGECCFSCMECCKL